jgi:murein DD-endopeptidase MepM/ murein hydrolase activator NlpD
MMTTEEAFTAKTPRTPRRGSSLYRVLWLFGVLGVLGVLAVNASSDPLSLEGTWRGVLGGKLHLALTVTRNPNGQYKMILDSIDQGATLPVDTINLKNDSINFGVSSVSGKFDGALNAARTEMKGTWTQPGLTLPLTLERGKLEPPPPGAKAPAPSKPLDAPIDVRAPIAPELARIDGRDHLVHELHVTNFSRRDVTLRRVALLAADGGAANASGGGRALATLEGAELANLVARPGGADANGLERLVIPGGGHAVVYLWVALDGAAPKAIEHRLTVRVADDPDDWTVTTARVPVRDELVALAPPLRGGDWMAGNGPSATSHHRRALLEIGGRAVIAQRFAIDWVRVDAGGLTFSGDRAQNKSYRAYGAEALAVADGVITEIKDGIPENVPGATRAVPITMETIAGNHVVIDLGHGRYALYAHLQPRSLRVKVGDRVRRGQVLGLVGNSGNSTQPHLHFHVDDAPSQLGSEGVPYVIDAFELRDKAGAFKPVSKQLPAEMEVVRFAQ